MPKSKKADIDNKKVGVVILPSGEAITVHTGQILTLKNPTKKPKKSNKPKAPKKIAEAQPSTTTDITVQVKQKPAAKKKSKPKPATKSAVVEKTIKPEQ